IVLDERRDNIAQLQDATVSETAKLLSIQLRPESQRAVGEGGTTSSVAYNAYLEGRGYLQCQDEEWSLDSAEQRFNAAIKADSGFALAYAGLGEVKWQRFNLTNDANFVAPAISLSSRALELNDRLAPVLVTLGILHRTTGQYQEAISYLKQALQIDSLNGDAIVQLALAYEASGRMQEAEATYHRSIQLRPHYWRGHYRLARFYAFRGQASAAMTEAAVAESLAPSATFPYESLGSLYTYLGHYDKARQLLERSLAIEPNYVSLCNLGAIYQIDRQYQKAVNMYERALTLNDRDYRVWSSVAWMYKVLPNGKERSRSDYQRAIELAEQNRKINPQDPSVICYLADCYWQVGSREKAVAMAQEAIQLAPSDIEVMVRTGIIFEEAGRRDQALKLISSAVCRGYTIDRIQATDELRELMADPRFDSLVKLYQDKSSARK
ncbi:MAG TPA: tetratricopeptide repeat protein, partial [Candidatus Acidoferrum sp.]|nr:tetratricopeptide repeat protein [Candidatus Acidoferrum sp.]